jgi:tellurite resistance protein
MKRFLIIAALAACFSIASNANDKCDNNWKEKMMSEKIAFLTMEMNITPEEAQVFWPVYNQVEKDKDAALGEVIMSHKALSAAVEQNNTSEIEKCLNAYLAAQNKLREADSKAAEQYKAVLPVEKVAKLYLAEEKFRRQHIRKLHDKGEKPQEKK